LRIVIHVRIYYPHMYAPMLAYMGAYM
jgi:hypothetical protein